MYQSLFRSWNITLTFINRRRAVSSVSKMNILRFNLYGKIYVLKYNKLGGSFIFERYICNDITAGLNNDKIFQFSTRNLFKIYLISIIYRIEIMNIIVIFSRCNNNIIFFFFSAISTNNTHRFII